MSLKSVTLYFREGSSDKVYQAAIEAASGGYVVNFAYGRRGSSLKAGTKTNTPLPLAEAEAVYEKLIGEKTSKGYTPGEDGTPYQAVPGGAGAVRERSSYVPQLLNVIPSEQAALLLDDDTHIMQEKKDGERCVLDHKDGAVKASNKKGLLTFTSSVLEKAALKLPEITMDGEAIGDEFFAFDLLREGDKDLRKEPYEKRLERLEAILKKKAATFPIRLVPTGRTPAEKRALFAKLKAEGREGVVFKNKAAPYVAGRPSSGGNQLKHKFYETCSVVVSRINGKRSVGMDVLSGGSRVDVGNVTVPPNKDLPGVGDIIEVRYLYAYVGGALFQATYLGKRSDVDAEECLIEQLKYKPGTKPPSPKPTSVGTLDF